MLYTSTRNNTLRVSAAQAIAQGISAEGGLFVPLEIPPVDLDFIRSLASLDYAGRAARILSLYLEDFNPDELARFAAGAYGGGRFSGGNPAPLANIYGGLHLLELWKGPTCAFKDMALQMLPYLLTASVKKTGTDSEIIILVATSGDTGKAALEGFRDVPGVKILVFYPVEGVSPMQKLQMTTQRGDNVGVMGVIGNFDDAQTGVKNIFTDAGVNNLLKERNMSFSSANSINWGRLVPQIVYYFSAYCDLMLGGKIKEGEKINIAVPTGNFGNILAAYFAKRMGLPVNKLICASNRNNILTDFFETGVYDRNREFFATSSPSMDILISSNLERLLFLMNDYNDAEISALFASLAAEGRYEVGGGLREKIRADFACGCCGDEAALRTIRETYEKHGYLCDTHTAVAVNVYETYVRETGDGTPAVIVSTASPYKFCGSVLSALKSGGVQSKDEFALLKELEELTGIKVPEQLSSLAGSLPRFEGICAKDKMAEAVKELVRG